MIDAMCGFADSYSVLAVAEYVSNGDLIPRNTSVIVKRVPASKSVTAHNRAYVEHGMLARSGFDVARFASPRTYLLCGRGSLPSSLGGIQGAATQRASGTCCCCGGEACNG